MRAGQGRRRNHPRSVPIDAPHVSPRQCARLIRQAASARPQWQRCDLLLVFATTNGEASITSNGHLVSQWPHRMRRGDVVKLERAKLEFQEKPIPTQQEK